MMELRFGPNTKHMFRPNLNSLSHSKTKSSLTILLKMSNNTSGPEVSINYPKPLSPPLPPISKQMELSRAMSASSKSTLFSLNRIDVIFEDQWLLVVNKPSGVYCEAVLSSVPRLLGAESNFPELHLANRLDRDTSGVMLITKLHKVAAKLVKAFTDHKVKKTYLAYCIGKAPLWRTITIRSGHGRSKFGAWRVYASSDVGCSLPGGSQVKDMQTFFEVLSVNGKGCSSVASGSNTSKENIIVVEEKSSVNDNPGMDEILVRAYPQSGRTHQIRLHCQYLGISIRGDVKYEGVVEWKGETYEGHELHAETLSFEHPMTGLPVIFRAPLPSWAKDAPQL